MDCARVHFEGALDKAAQGKISKMRQPKLGLSFAFLGQR